MRKTPLLLILLLAPLTWAQTSQPAAPIIELRGNSTALGETHGKKLSEDVRAAHTLFFDKALEGADAAAIRAGAKAFEPHLRPEHLTEIKALAAAAGVEQQNAMLANCFLDLMPMQACSTLSLPPDAAPDRVARFARNLDFPSYGVLDKSSVVLVFHPDDGRFRFVTIGWPGMIGAVSGMNEHGLTLANMEVTRPAGDAPQAMPYTLLYRTLLERCKTTAEAIEMLKTTARQTANNLMLMDAAGNRAVVELTRDAVTVRPGQDAAALISTNHQRGEDGDTPGKCKRYDYLHDTAKSRAGKLDRDALVEMLRHVQQEDMTIQSMIFEPSNRTIYLATGDKAPEREFVKIDLKDYFHK